MVAIIEVLNKVEAGKLSSKKAYKLLYPKIKDKSNKKLKRAHFIKVKIKIAESKGVTRLLRVLLALPFPVGLVKMIIKRNISDIDDKNYLKSIVFYKKRPIEIKVNKEVYVLLKPV